MAVIFALGLRACCVAVGLLLVTARAAEPVSPLVGQTRDQVLRRYGEPRSQMVQGNRVIFLYPRERIVLRDNIVVEVEEFAAAEPAPSSPPATTAPAASDETTTAGPPPSPGPEPKIEIKLVRPPSAKDPRPSIPEPEKRAAPLQPAPAPVGPKTMPAVTRTPAEPRPEPKVELEPAPLRPAAQTPSADDAAEKEAAEKKAAEKKATDELEARNSKEEALNAARRRRQESSTPEPAESMFSGRMYLIALAAVAGGAGLLYWRHRQRQLELAASSVENTELTAPSAPVFTGNGFTADVLSRLDWTQFEELVAAYYSKTGVVAVRTKSGPESPVHIKISWKGEPRPFAYVQCIPHPTGLIDPKPLQSLVAALAADNIRRGYVVTSGKFSVPARDFAGEKHLTLLPGDIFLEKLNALPAAAPTEIMQAVSGPDAT